MQCRQGTLQYVFAIIPVLTALLSKQLAGTRSVSNTAALRRQFNIRCLFDQTNDPKERGRGLSASERIENGGSLFSMN